ncbi:MAG: response regulator transcription factor [Gemmatimonadetes bacterium]|nr:response regulator transcription factor [Gemmatimonadota bacterium]
MPKIRILIGDHRGVVRAGLKLLIDNEPDMEVVAEAEDGIAAVKLAGRLKPDIALVDLSMPRMRGLQVIDQILQLSPHSRVVIFTAYEDPVYVAPALAAGAVAYLVKSIAASDFLSAIRAVHTGATLIYLDAAHGGVRRVVEAAQSSRTANPAGRARLSSREREVLAMVARGFTHREIARKLGIEPKTVETYRSRLGQKLRIHTRAELVRFAIDMGLLATG